MVFIAGLCIGGATSATALWTASGLFRPLPAWVALAAIASVGTLMIAREFDIATFPLPQNARQVPESIFLKGALRSSLQFGFELGTGARTLLTSSSPYLLAVALLVHGTTLPITVATGAAFGLGRAIMPLLRYIRQDPRRLDQELRLSHETLKRTSVVLVAFGVTWLSLPL